MGHTEGGSLEIGSLVVRLAGLDPAAARWLAEELGRRLAEELVLYPLRSAAGPAELYVLMPAGTPDRDLPSVIAHRIRMEMS